MTEMMGGTILKFDPKEIQQGHCVIYSSGPSSYAVCKLDENTIQILPVQKQVQYTKDNVRLEQRGEAIKIKTE